MDDFTELDLLAEDLVAVAAGLVKTIPKAVEVTARHVKDDARASVRRRRYFGQAAHAIDYELLGFQGSSFEAEVGYNRSIPSGRLGNLLEYGAPNAPRMMNVPDGAGGWKTVPVPGGGKRPLAPGGELQSALEGNEDDLERGIGIALDDALKEAGL